MRSRTDPAFPRLLLAVSAHGYGHLAQCAPVINALRACLPGLRLTVRSGLPPAYLASRLDGQFAVQARSDDFGVCNRDALEVDLEATAGRYRDLHRDWPRHLAEVARELRSAAPDLVLADIPYLTLAAAQRAGIPNLALCSLNWAEIYRHYFGHRPESAAIQTQIRAAYAGTERFLRPQPAMAMQGLANLCDIGPIARCGRCRRSELTRRLGLGEADKLVLISMGGIAMRPVLEDWPRVKGLYWLVPRDWGGRRTDARALEDSGLDYTDLVASCDALVCKPGYGSFSEAAAAGTPVLYVRRDGWPEQHCLLDWLHANARCAGVDRLSFERGALIEPLLALLGQGRYVPIRPSGTEQAVELIRPWLD